MTANPELHDFDCPLPEVIHAPRTDPVYNAHGYLTKVPVAAIIPYIETFCPSGGLVVDMFAGSGMTGVAAKMSGRNAALSDISALGQHIARGYLSDVSADKFRKAASNVVQAARKRVASLYATKREADESKVEAIRTIWSFVYKCQSCEKDVTYYDALRQNDWKAPEKCPHCGGEFSKRTAIYSHDVPVVTVVDGVDGKQVEQQVSALDLANIKKAEKSKKLAEIPSLTIEPDREMYRRSALGKWNLRETKDFFSARNALVLLEIWNGINEVADKSIRQKLLFAFTAILPRASRRYQWSHQRPLNAANQNYYIAPVYYEWNVFDLFERKIEAAIRSDAEIATYRSAVNPDLATKHEYVLASADSLRHLSDSSVDFVYSDPPFGSNIFYSDMNLFQEAWLPTTTEHEREAVIHTSPKKKSAAAKRYEEILAGACREAFRVLKPGSHFSLVFGNSKGTVWSMVQRALRDSGFEQKPVHIGILDKGQRSVKGLNSGSEGVATLDLIITVRKPVKGQSRRPRPSEVTPRAEDIIKSVVSGLTPDSHPTPSHVYLVILRRAMSDGILLDDLHLSDVLVEIRRKGFLIDPKTGRLHAKH